MVTLHDTFDPSSNGFLVDTFDEDGNLISSSFVDITEKPEFDEDTVLELNDIDAALKKFKTLAAA